MEPQTDRKKLVTQQKALAINLDQRKYGTFAEIGAGQEVVTLDAVADEVLTYRELVILVRAAVGSRSRLVTLPARVILPAARVIGWSSFCAGMLPGTNATTSTPSCESTSPCDTACRPRCDIAARGRHFRAPREDPGVGRFPEVPGSR